MVDAMTVREAAALWDITERRVTELCREGRIDGAVKTGGSWTIPRDSRKPSDSRIRTGAYKKCHGSPSFPPLPIGVSDYRIASTEYYYVDKTMMIRDIIDERPFVSLFTRPRRFGKTLNMDMLRTFFEKTDEDTSVYFRDKLIWKQGERYQRHQGEYPVLFISFKDVKFSTWEETLDAIRKIISAEANRHLDLLTSEKCSDKEKRDFEKLLSMEVSAVELSASLHDLSLMLHKHHGKAPVVIVDEYDTPIQNGHMQGFYDEVILFMRNMFSGVFKDNSHLSFGFLTGILGVAKESIFSGLDNLVTNSILDNRYSTYFGFTSEEVRKIARCYSCEDKYPEICEWYDGYRFGNTEIFNPWSVLNYFRNDSQPGAYWQSTGSNDVIGEILGEIDSETGGKLVDLMDGKEVISSIDTGVVYPEVRRNPSSVFSFLLVAGYLKAVETYRGVVNDYMCKVAIPNREIVAVYRKEILLKMESMFPLSSVNAIQEALFSSDAAMLQKYLGKLLLQSASCFDSAGENFYQGLMLGLTATLCSYVTKSNRESGDGRYDIELKPLVRNLPGIIIELKAGKNCSDEALRTMAEDALRQIEERMYDTELRAEGVDSVIKFGVAFSGKRVAVAVL